VQALLREKYGAMKRLYDGVNALQGLIRRRRNVPVYLEVIVGAGAQLTRVRETFRGSCPSSPRGGRTGWRTRGDQPRFAVSMSSHEHPETSDLPDVPTDLPKQGGDQPPTPTTT
jgi:hypothetical protein